MSHEQSNKYDNLDFMVKRYQQTQSDELYSEIYETITKLWRKAIRRNATLYGIETEEVECIAHEKLAKISLSYDPPNGPFTMILFTAIKNGCKDELDKRTRNAKKEYLTSPIIDEDGTETDLLDNVEIKVEGVTPNAETEAVESLQKNSDQRQLIANLRDCVDEKARQSLDAFEESDYSFKGAAKLLGVSDNTVRNRIQSIARYYDTNRFGDIHDYFTAS